MNNTSVTISEVLFIPCSISPELYVHLRWKNRREELQVKQTAINGNVGKLPRCTRSIYDAGDASRTLSVGPIVLRATYPSKSILPAHRARDGR